MDQKASHVVTTPQTGGKFLAGKVALITGSSRGIGEGIALHLAELGASIVVVYATNPTKAKSVVDEIEKLGSQAISLQCDVSKPNEIVKLFEDAIAHFGKLDIVLSNAGVEAWAKEEDVTQEMFDRVFNINCRGQFFVAQQGYKHLSRGGRIILTSSIAAQMYGVPNHSLYAGSKAAVEGFARSFAKDCGPKAITCNAIAPGGVMSDMFHENAWHYAPNGTPDTPVKEIEAKLAAMNPLGRVASAKDIAKCVGLICHPDSEWINGQTILMSGGSGNS
ncbi:putative versicolorin reductase [Xylogone sp. PMI_703]|nr:putative versicolorin reductase [Xylogone sp. PMI_703]